jgi:hypothetical protein
MKSTALAIALLANGAQSWSIPRHSASFQQRNVALRMAEEESLDKVQLTSARKEVVFDEKTGRFYETGLGVGECGPENGEFCAIDNETGEQIKLTVAEKERIFLDALQVRESCINV